MPQSVFGSAHRVIAMFKAPAAAFCATSGCPALATSLFLSLGWETTDANSSRIVSSLGV